MTLEQAKRAIAAAEKKAQQLGVPEVVAVVDEGGNLKALERMDGASLMAIDIAIAKAKTTVFSGLPTKGFYEFVKSDSVLADAMFSVPGVCLIPGGIPITVAGKAIGAIGVAAGHHSQDHQCAEAGAAALA